MIYHRFFKKILTKVSIFISWVFKKMNVTTKKRNTCAIHHRLGSVAKYSHFQGHKQVTNLQKALRTPDTRQMLDARPHGFLAWRHFAIFQLGLLYMRQCFKVATTVCALFVTTPKEMLVSRIEASFRSIPLKVNPMRSKKRKLIVASATRASA